MARIINLMPGLRIVAADGSFVIGRARVESPPFFVSGSPFRVPADGRILDPETLAAAQRDGARRVWVHINGQSAAFYGLLWLGQVQETASGPAARAYHLEVSRKNLADATSGLVAAVWEPFPLKLPVEPLYDQHKNMWYYPVVAQATGATWVLWLSDLPLPGVSGQPDAPPGGSATSGTKFPTPSTADRGVRACGKDTDCVRPAVCVEGTCKQHEPGEAPSCSKDVDCAPPMVCENGSCRTP